MGKQSHNDQIFFFFLSLDVFAYLCQTHCLVPLLAGSVQQSRCIQGRVT